MTEWIIVNGARIEKEFLEGKIREAREQKWSVGQWSDSENHDYCMVCIATISVTDSAHMASQAGSLCMGCYDQFIAE